MFLRSKLLGNREHAPASSPVPITEAVVSKPAGALGPVDSAPDPFAEIKIKAHQLLIGLLRERGIDDSASFGEVTVVIREALDQAITAGSLLINRLERDRLVEELYNEARGLGPLEPLIADDSITEVMVNNAKRVYIERSGRIELTRMTFYDDRHLLRIIDRIVSRIGRHIDEASPMCDARLPDGSRVNAIIPPLSIDGPALTIRKFRKDPLKVEDLLGYETMTTSMSEFLNACVKAKLNVLISGGTGSGKTTLLNVLSSFIPNVERLITIEDAAELQLQQEHVIRLETRPGNAQGAGVVDQHELLRNCLRMRPDRIILGEVRGKEALTMLQAMNTGHEGSLATVHANTCREALARLETMVLMSGAEIPLRAIREQINAALDLIVQTERSTDGRRRITSITEVVGMEGDCLQLQELFTFHREGVDAEGNVLGHHRATGLRPKCADRLALSGCGNLTQIMGRGA